MLHCRSFEEKRIRSRSADPSKRFRKTDIFNTDLTANDSTVDGKSNGFSSEYKKAFIWHKGLEEVDEEAIKKRLNPVDKQHAAGLSSKQCAFTNKAHVIQNSNGSTSIVIANEPATDYALTTGSATNLATMVNTIPQDTVRPLTSLALIDSDFNKSILSNNGLSKINSQVNKSVTITNINDYTNKPDIDIKQLKDRNNNASSKKNELDEDLLMQKLSKLNAYESIYGKKAGASTLFHKEEVFDPNNLDKMPKKSEYKSKFKPFSTYVYVTGKGWFKPKKIKAKEETQKVKKIEVHTPINVNKDFQDTMSVKSVETTISTKPLDVTDSINGEEETKSVTALIKQVDEIDAIIEKKGQPWYQEALERKLKANEFRYRSEYGNPILGRTSLEEVYKKASGNKWEASSNPKFEQLQQMRISNSAFLPFDQHRKKMQDKTDGAKKEPQTKSTPSKSPRTKRAKSVPPRKKSTGNIAPTTTNKTTKPSTTQPAQKVWIKPKAKETSAEDNKETKENKVQRPPQINNLNKELKQAEEKSIDDSKKLNGRASPPIIGSNIQSGPVRTTQIKTPEELVGIKSPPPENWMEVIDNEPINWTNSTTNPSSLNSNATYTANLMNEFKPTSIRSDNLADLRGLNI